MLESSTRARVLRQSCQTTLVLRQTDTIRPLIQLERLENI